MRATRSAFPARAWQPALLWAVWQVSVLLGAGQAPAGSGNLLRNADFQDDWITLLPENKTLHWCYFSDFTNRRDYNPDAWSCKGFWRWADPLAPRGNRRLILAGPRATLVQRVNWVTVHDARTVLSLADAGGFPAAKCQSSRKPLRLVRDLTFRVRVKGTAVPSGAGSVDLALCPPGKVSLADPMGSEVAPTASVSVPLPAGTFDWRWVEVRLAASAWRKAAPANGPDVPLPGTVRVAARYQAGDGQVELGRTELTAPGPDSPNLLANGGFERAGKDGYPAGWNQPAKYGYFPPRNYYLFTTWHNASSPNRGPVGGDGLVARGGARSLRMIVAAGDEKSVSCRPITLNQAEPRLLEVAAWVKTDHLCSLHVDAMNEAGRRLDGFSFLQKAPVSIGTDRWRLIRQVFRPRRPVGSLTLMLCARGANGYTLDDTGLQPQNNVVGTVWWDDVRLHEPESTAAELARRGVRPPADRAPKAGLHLAELDLGERMLGENVLRGVVVNPGPPARVSRARRLVAMTAAFVGSGVMHEILLLYVMVCVAVGRGREEGRASARHRPPLLPLPPQPGFCPYSGYWFVYFTSQALGLIAEGALARAWTARGLPPPPRWLAVPAVVGSGLLWAHWLFLPPVHNTTLGARVLDSLDGSARWIVGALSGGKR